MLIDFETARILGVALGRGPTADLTLFKEGGVRIAPEVWCLADLGYQGSQDVHPQTVCQSKSLEVGA